jgi:CRP-like cAMP-binding protein
MPLKCGLAKNDRLRQEAGANQEYSGYSSRGLEELDKLLSDERKIVSIKKKHTIFSEGSHPHALYYIIQGKIKTFKTNEEGREFITGLHGADEFIGYIDLLEENRYTESATALEESRLCLIQKQDFFSLLHQNREVSGKFIKLLTNNVIDKEDRLLKLAYNSVRKRVAESLLMMYSRYDNENSSENGFPVSREDLSALTGASKETVIRTLSDFKDEKLIEISGKMIRIINKTKLEKMKN